MMLCTTHKINNQFYSISSCLSRQSSSVMPSTTHLLPTTPINIYDPTGGSTGVYPTDLNKQTPADQAATWSNLPPIAYGKKHQVTGDSIRHKNCQREHRTCLKRNTVFTPSVPKGTTKLLLLLLSLLLLLFSLLLMLLLSSPSLLLLLLFRYLI